MTVKNKAIAQGLSRWFKKNARVLPWRSHPDPYWVWLSEIMLQQTQVTAVLPYFERFITEFPTVEGLAQASLDEVYVLWAGLGYYSRARNLHKGAKEIAKRLKLGQGFPANRQEWLLIPGVGEYTAGAICSIALMQREALVDGNVVRVISRLFAIPRLDLKKTKIWAHADQLVQERSVRPDVLNQSLMELGALVCKPRNPKCEVCPLSDFCKGKKYPERYPEPKKKKEWKKLKEHRWVMIRRVMREESTKQYSAIQFYLEINKKGFWREGLWDFPIAGTLPEIKAASVVHEFVSKYVVTNHKIERLHTVLEINDKKSKKVLSSKPKSSLSSQLEALPGSWHSLADLPAVPSPVRKALEQMINLKSDWSK